MAKNISGSIEENFGSLKDPRRETKNKQHKLLDILVISICGCICGANDFVAIERFGKSKEGWFTSFLELPNEIPSHDTFTNVFAQLCPESFEQCFIAWVSTICFMLPGEVVAIDGKTLRRSHNKSTNKSAIHMVSAWARDNSLVLGQVKTEEKSNEITAIPELLNQLMISGCLITIDAMGCQKKIVETIVEKDADYLIALKENQPKLYESVTSHFDSILSHFDENNEKEWLKHTIDYAKSIEDSHGRHEERRCWVCYDLKGIVNRDQWKKLTSIVMIESKRTLNGKTSIEHRYYISSSSNNAKYLLQSTRYHWGIENSLHWVLDVAFREDDSRIRKGFAAQNMAILRHIALNLLKKENTAKVGIQNKRLMAGWDHHYLKKILNGFKI